MRTILMVLLSGSVWSQPSDPKDSFDAATIKRAAQDAGDPQVAGFTSLEGGPGTADPGRVAYRNVSLRTLLTRAYGVENDQILGPGSLATERYDLTATLPPGSTKEQFQRMLRNLLVERFQLTLHREQREFPIYELGLAKSGPKIKAGDDSRQKTPPAGGAGMPADKNGFPLPPVHQTSQAAREGIAKFAANQITMDAFAQFLRLPMRFFLGTAAARVVDKTGLGGEYSFTLEYQWPAPLSATAASNAASIFEAVQQQLGLRLTESKAVFDVVVIDHAEKIPRED